MLDDSPPDHPRRGAARPSLAAACVLALLAWGASPGSMRADADAPPADGESGAAPASGEDTPAAAVSESVVVSATRVERSVEDVPLSVTVVGRDEITRLPVRTTDDLIRTIPGINMPPGTSTYLFPATQTFSMRGAGARRALVLEDGVPATDPFSGAVEWNKISLARLERVEVVRGGGASVFGSQALGGLVNFVTRRAGSDALEAEGGGGSYGTRTADFAVSRMVTRELGLGAEGSWFETDGFQHESPRDRGKVDIPMAARHANGRLHADWSDGDASAGFSAAASNEFLSLGTPLSNQNRRIEDLAGRAEIPAIAGRLAASGWFQHERVAYDNTAFFAGQGRNAEFRANHHEEPIQALGGSLLWSRSGTGVLPFVAAGVDLQAVRADDRADNFDTAGSVTQRVVGGGRQTFTGVFVEASFAPSAALEVLASARWDSWRNFDGHQVSRPGDAARIEPRTEGRLDPRLSARLSVAEGVAVRAAIYRSFRAPTLRELYYQTLSKTQQTLSNPDLGPEKSWGGEAGADFSRGAWTAAATAFASRIEATIGQVEVSTGPPRVLRSYNVGDARAEGVEAELDWKPSPVAVVRATYAYTESKVISSALDPTLVGKWIAGVPRNAAGLTAIWADAAGRSAAIRARSYSRQYVDASNRLALDPAALFDLEAAYPLPGGLSLSAACDNVFDRRYIVDLTSGRRLGDPRTFRIALRWSIGSPAPRPPA